MAEQQSVPLRPREAVVRLRRYASRVERLKRSKRRFVQAAAALTPYLVAEKTGGHFVLPVEAASKLFVGVSRSEFVVLDRAVQTLRASGLLREGGSIVDVGANVGTTTIPALAVYGFETAVAIEPDPDNARLLRTNVALNGLHDRARVIQAGASSSGGTAIFDRSREHREGIRIGSGRLVCQPGPGTLEVELVSLNDLVDRRVIDPELTSLVWIDVQGHEGDVLLGAGELTRRRVPIVFAFRPHRLQQREALVEVLEEHYAFLVDLRSPHWKAGWRAKGEPVDQLGQRFGERRSTDILVCPGPVRNAAL